MNRPAWFAGSLLALLAVQSVRAEPPRPPVDAPTTEQQALRRAVAEEAHARRDSQPAAKMRRLSPEERSKLRQDVSDASRSIYPRPIPARY